MCVCIYKNICIYSSRQDIYRVYSSQHHIYAERVYPDSTQAAARRAGLSQKEFDMHLVLQDMELVYQNRVKDFNQVVQGQIQATNKVSALVMQMEEDARLKDARHLGDIATLEREWAQKLLQRTSELERKEVEVRQQLEKDAGQARAEAADTKAKLEARMQEMEEEKNRALQLVQTQLHISSEQSGAERRQVEEEVVRLRLHVQTLQQEHKLDLEIAQQDINGLHQALHTLTKTSGMQASSD